MTARGAHTPYIVSTLRSAFAPVHGALARYHPVDLLAEIICGVKDGGLFEEDPLMFCAVPEPVGAQAGNVAEAAMAVASWPLERPPVILSGGEFCGLAALNAALDAVRTGRSDVALATGVASASVVPPGASLRSRDFGRAWADHSPPPSPSQACEQRARARAIGRDQLREWADRMRNQDNSPNDTPWIHSIVEPSSGTTPSADEAPNDLGDECTMFEDDGVITASSWAGISDGAAVVVIHRRHDGPAAAVVQRCAWRSQLPPKAALTALTEDIAWSTVDSQCAVIDLEIVDALGLDPDTVNLLGSPLLRGRPQGVSNLAAAIDGHQLALKTALPGLIVCASVEGSVEAVRVEPA
ncbi:MAG: hypothetical protein IH940_05055 [Acidobacteria bacterium]|nr:hypothetical protein [Acidobacteriota bacterium]